MEQYVENQILGAKLLFALTPKSEPPDLARITCTLEHAHAFLEHQRNRVGEKKADELQGGIEQLLGFAYLGWWEHEPQAIAAFDRLFGLRNWSGLDAIRFRCWLGRAKAQTRFARTQRRQFSRGAAALMRKQAAEDLAKVATLFDAFDFGAAVPEARRQRNLRLRLDAGIAFQALAEERFAADETVDAKGLCEKETSVLVALHVALDEGVVGGDDLPQIRKQVQQCKARLSFLSGLIAIRDDPSFKDADLIQKVKNRFDEARGINTDLDCRIDLALGELLLVAARLGKGDSVSLYREAIVALERAAGRDVPLLRADTILALASAYAARGNVLRRPKASATVK